MCFEKNLQIIFTQKEVRPKLQSKPLFILATYHNLRNNFEIINFLEVWKQN